MNMIIDSLLQLSPSCALYQFHIRTVLGGNETISVSFVHGAAIIHHPDSEWEVAGRLGNEFYEALGVSL